MLTVTLLVSLVCGVILCFFGYRFFRLAMTLAGFILGAGLGYFIYNMTSKYLPGNENGWWVYLFMVVGGILLGLLSYSVYKAALFYITMFVTAFVVLKTFLLTMASGVGIASFFVVMFGESKVGSAANSVTDTPVGGGQTIGTAINTAIEKLPGSSMQMKFWVVVGFALLAGAIVGFVVCMLQKPAIIVVTSVFGGLLITQGLFSIIQSFGSFDADPLAFAHSLAIGSREPALSTIVVVAFIFLGILTQFKTAKKTS
jgi:hypothetical protein